MNAQSRWYLQGFDAGYGGREAASCPWRPGIEQFMRQRKEWFDGFDDGCFKRLQEEESMEQARVVAQKKVAIKKAIAKNRILVPKINLSGQRYKDIRLAQIKAGLG